MGIFNRSNTESVPAFTNEDKSNLRWFWQNYLREKSRKLTYVFLLVVFQGVIYQQFLSLTDRSLRVVFEGGAMQDLIWICLLVFAVFFFRGVTAFIIPRVSTLIASDAVMKMRNDLVRHMMVLDLEFFERTTPGDMILRMVHQADGLSEFVGQTTVRALRDCATIIIISGYLIYQQPMLFSIAAIVIPVLAILMQIVSRQIKEIQRSSENAISQYMDAIDEVVSGMRTVKMSNQIGVEQDRLNTATSKIKSINVRLQTAQAMAQPFVDFSAAFVYMLVIGGGGYVVLSPEYDVDGASIVTFLLGLMMVFDPARRLAQFWAKLQSALVILSGVRSLHQMVPNIIDAPDATTDFDASADIVLDNVKFAYNSSDRTLFENLDLTFSGKTKTAIVGTTGSGKTTILSLLARLYDVDEGEVRIGGVSIKAIQQSALRDAFSVVSQDIVIFNASILENIRYVRPEATLDEVRAAAQAAEVLELMETRGEIPVGPKGAQLSGGQRQRIGIARAFLRQAPIVFLDEATSALDQKTEDKVKRALDRLSLERTTIMVAHRLSAVMSADVIYVLENGKLIEQGTHASLMQAEGFYYSLFSAQQKNYEV